MELKMLCEKNLETGLNMLGAPVDVRDFLERGGTVVIPCPTCGDSHLLAIRQHGHRSFEVIAMKLATNDSEVCTAYADVQDKVQIPARRAG
jgi:hypothetical protein